MKKFFEIILSLIYPNKCIFCDDVIKVGYEDKMLCENCFNELYFYDDNKNNENIENYKNYNYDFVAVFEYKNNVRKSIHRFKFGFHPEYAEKYGELMELKLKTSDKLKAINFDYVIGVPMYYKKERHRGYNQADLLASELAKRMEMPYNKGVLIRTKNTKPQSKLKYKERQLNLKNAFEIKEKGFFYGKVILLVDDIYTTGSTIRGCIEMLKSDGAKEIYVIILAKTVRE